MIMNAPRYMQIINGLLAARPRAVNEYAMTRGRSSRRAAVPCTVACPFNQADRGQSDPTQPICSPSNPLNRRATHSATRPQGAGHRDGHERARKGGGWEDRPAQHKRNTFEHRGGSAACGSMSVNGFQRTTVWILLAPRAVWKTATVEH